MTLFGHQTLLASLSFDTGFSGSVAFTKNHSTLCSENTFPFSINAFSKVRGSLSSFKKVFWNSMQKQIKTGCTATPPRVFPS